MVCNITYQEASVKCHGPGGAEEEVDTKEWHHKER